MSIIQYLYEFLNLLVISYLILPFGLVLFSFFTKKKTISASKKQYDYACIITAYQTVDMALPLVDSLIKQNHKTFKIYLVADACDTSNIKIPKGVELLVPKEKLQSKVKSIIFAINHFERSHDAIIVFDPDNLVLPEFLSQISSFLDLGYKAVQGRRVAKNLDSVYACVEAAGEIYMNYMTRQVPSLIGSSASIAGSGMAIETKLFEEYLKQERIVDSIVRNEVIVAEDKILQNFIVKKGHQIGFAWNAIIYDEKITKGEQLEKQRSRWLYSYFEDLPNAINLIMDGIVKLKSNQIIFGMMNISPPLILLLIIVAIVLIIDLIFSMSLFIATIVALLIFSANIFLTLALSNAPRKVWLSVWGIPLFILKSFVGLLKMNRSKTDFMHTKHKKKIYVDDLKKKKK
jgi:cellulose synthase/poly-beta-1,6-N-acetylglucosamine synthase-like glycosyltransferase